MTRRKDSELLKKTQNNSIIGKSETIEEVDEEVGKVSDGQDSVSQTSIVEPEDNTAIRQKVLPQRSTT